MRNYSKNLYKKFLTRVMNTLSGDDFYEYFMKVVNGGARKYGQKNDILVKTIDERWVVAIEKALPSLENIIRKPRKFIRREENVVPVELARKVGSDAVKHLATHTHFISRIAPGGQVIPSKILNVYNEESLEIYENRFIITLIKRISDFIDRRYDVLFSTKGDEFQTLLSLNSEFNDNDEKVEYDLKIKLHQGQSYLDNQNNDPAIFDRIEHIRMMVTSFKNTDFFQSLINCAPIRSPVSKTNLITKETNFRTCHELWQFLDRYGDVGYTIERSTINADFSEEYIEQLNTIILFQYLVLKNNLAPENNKAIDVTQYKKKRSVKPKFIRQIVDEYVNDYDITELELRQVFDAEISKAYAQQAQNEQEILDILKNALGEEQKKKEEATQEAEILGALQRAFAIEAEKEEEEKKRIEEQAQEAEILNALRRAMEIEEDKQQQKQEEEKSEAILNALRTAISQEEEKAETKKKKLERQKSEQEDSIANAIKRALSSSSQDEDDEEWED